MLILHSLFKIFVHHSRCLHLRQLDQEEVVPRMTMMVPYIDSRSSRLSVTFAELVLTIVFFNNNVLIFLTLLQANQRWQRQQRRGLGASAVSKRSAEDANLLSVPNPPRRNVTHGVMSERYHLGGRVETDTVAMAAARQDQAGIQRRHRLEHRHGDDPSQTPPFISPPRDISRHRRTSTTATFTIR